MTARETCPICGGRRVRHLRGYERAYLMRCVVCGMTFAGRIPSAAELEAHYAGYGHAWIDSPITRDRYRELLDSFEPYRRRNRLLDAGCGAGFFLDEARARGWEVRGTEYGAHARQLCRDKGLEVVRAPIDDTTFRAADFDVITSFEVFEHLPDPRAEAASLVHALRPGGLLYCTTPNWGALSRRVLRSAWRPIDYPEHLSYFTVRTLRAWLTDFGLAPVAIESSGISLTQLRTHIAGSTAETPEAREEQRLRVALESSPTLRRSKAAANGMLSALGLGDTLKARFELWPP